MSYQIEGLTLATTQMKEMIAFYTAVFEMNFDEQEMHGHKLYASKWGDLSLLLCPAELARNTATQNRHQFDVTVDDLERVIEKATANHGSLMYEPSDYKGGRSVGIYDPDHNSIVFKQLVG